MSEGGVRPAYTHTFPCVTAVSTAVKATKEEMDKNQVDLALRDACAHLLIPLNKCVRALARLLAVGVCEMRPPTSFFSAIDGFAPTQFPSILLRCRCRRMTFFLPWKCEDERHGYEACQYAE